MSRDFSRNAAVRRHLGVGDEKLSQAHARQLIAKQMSEKQLLQNVRDMAHANGWMTYHTHRSDRSEPGYPDLHLVRGGRSLFVELKSETGRTTGDQAVWLEALARAGHTIYVWRPSDWMSGEIERVLR